MLSTPAKKVNSKIQNISHIMQEIIDIINYSLKILGKIVTCDQSYYGASPPRNDPWFNPNFSKRC